METVVTTGAVRCVKLQSNHHNQQTNTLRFLQASLKEQALQTSFSNTVRVITFTNVTHIQVFMTKTYSFQPLLNSVKHYIILLSWWQLKMFIFTSLHYYRGECLRTTLGG